MGHSKPTSVNVNTRALINDPQKLPSQNLITSNAVGLPSRTSITQKPNTEIKPSSGTGINRGIGISTSKPSSVANYSSSVNQSNVANRYSESSLSMSNYQPLNKPSLQAENVPTMMKKPNTSTTSAYQNYQTPLPIPTLPATISTLPNFTKQFIA